MSKDHGKPYASAARYPWYVSYQQGPDDINMDLSVISVGIMWSGSNKGVMELYMHGYLLTYRETILFMNRLSYCQEYWTCLHAANDVK